MKFRPRAEQYGTPGAPTQTARCTNLVVPGIGSVFRPGQPAACARPGRGQPLFARTFLIGFVGAPGPSAQTCSA